ncbi:hypothetical protein DMUE_5156 [Dictyocoela muelleri]|nr:hypothetical protein DMUE_5156 [Dictyocoela muelleri]
MFLKVLPDRKAGTLLSIIREVCENGTIFHSDKWACNRRVSDSYEHKTVNLNLSFVNPVTDVHTQNIESLWKFVKLKFKSMKGVHREHMQSYLDGLCGGVTLKMIYLNTFCKIYEKIINK